MTREPRGHRTGLRALAMLLLALAGAVAFAQTLPTTLPAPLREQLLALQARLAALDAPQREHLQQRVSQWDALPAAERNAQREAWQAWQALPEGERQQLHATHAAWLAMPPEQQQRLRQRYDALDAGVRQGWLLGPVVGSEWAGLNGLHGLLMQVPQAQRDALLAALRALPAQARADLATLSLRTAPQDRDALRNALLQTPEAARAAWLRERVSGP